MTTAVTSAQRYRPHSPAIRRSRLGCADDDAARVLPEDWVPPGARVLPLVRALPLSPALPVGRELREPDFPAGRAGARDDPPRAGVLRDPEALREAVPAREPALARGPPEAGRRAVVVLFFRGGLDGLPAGFFAEDFLLVLTACQRTGTRGREAARVRRRAGGMGSPRQIRRGAGSDPAEVGEDHEEHDHPDADAQGDRHGHVGVGAPEFRGRLGRGCRSRMIQAPMVGTCGMR